MERLKNRTDVNVEQHNRFVIKLDCFQKKYFQKYKEYITK